MTLVKEGKADLTQGHRHRHRDRCDGIFTVGEAERAQLQLQHGQVGIFSQGAG